MSEIISSLTQSIALPSQQRDSFIDDFLTYDPKKANQILEINYAKTLFELGAKGSVLIDLLSMHPKRVRHVYKLLYPDQQNINRRSIADPLKLTQTLDTKLNTNIFAHIMRHYMKIDSKKPAVEIFIQSYLSYREIARNNPNIRTAFDVNFCHFIFKIQSTPLRLVTSDCSQCSLDFFQLQSESATVCPLCLMSSFFTCKSCGVPLNVNDHAMKDPKRKRTFCASCETKNQISKATLHYKQKKNLIDTYACGFSNNSENYDSYNYLSSLKAS